MNGDEVRLGFAFPELYRWWKDHDLKYHEDLGSIRPWFYEGLKPQDEAQIWRFLEENYLLRYDGLLAVRFDWSSSGLWSIPFPGSRVDTGNFSDLKARGLSEKARLMLRKWHEPLDDMRRLEDDGYFDYEASDARGLAAAKEVKLSLGGSVYLEFRPFQEIVITDEGVARETEVPEFILEVSGGR